MSQNEVMLGFQTTPTIDEKKLKDRIKVIKKLVSASSLRPYSPEQARTYIRVIKQMQRNFSELYTVKDFAEKVIGVSKNTFESWEPKSTTYEKPAFKTAWDRVKAIALIQVFLVKIFQNKESIMSALVSDNDYFEQTFYEMIMSNNIEKQLELKNFLEAAEMGK